NNKQEILRSIGNPSALHIEYAKKIAEQIPEQLKNAAHSKDFVQALFFAIVIFRENDTDIDTSIKLIAQTYDNATIDAMKRYLTILKQQNISIILPLIDLSLTTLKELTKEQLVIFVKTIHTVFKSDKQISLFELLTSTLILNEVHKKSNTTDPIKYKNTKDLQKTFSNILYYLTQAGGGSNELQQQTYDKTMQLLGFNDYPPITSKSFSLKQLGEQLKNLKFMAPNLKSIFLEACVECILHDNQTTLQEAEILRAICYLMDLPMPPVIPNTFDESKK
ncbi:MAG: hypothetical protein KC414_12040, partial [Romboutsia sp.]|nr:hypothetical protein [Romboutsia sp.]